MKDEGKSKKQLLDELAGLRRRISDLEAAAPGRRHTEKKIKRAHSDLAQVLNVTVPLLIIRKDFTMLMVNKTYCDTFKKEEKDIIGKKCFELWRGPHCNTRKCAMRQILGGREEYAYQWKETYPDGKSSLFMVRAVPYRDADGEIAGIIENFTDITEQSQIEEALRESEARYRMLVDNFDGSITLFGLDGRLLLINDAGAKNIGGNPADFIGRPLFELFPDNADLLMERNLQVIESRKGGYFVDEFVLPSGKRWFWSNIQPVKDTRGKVMAVQIISSEITEQKKAEEALAVEKQQLAATLRSIGDAVITADTHGKIFLLNEAAEALTGWTQEEASGKPLDEVLHLVRDKTRRRYRYPIKKAFRAGGKIEVTDPSILIHRDGGEKVISASSSPIHDKKGDVKGIVLVLRDITEKKKIEEELQKSQKLESIGVLAGGIAHDFNNILTGILVNIELAKRYAKDSKKILDKLVAVETVSSRAQNLTQQLLTFSKGGVPIKALDYIKDEIRKSVEFALTGSNVRCKFCIQEDLWPASFDAGQIGQVINNLILNASQAMPGGGTIRIRAENIVVGSEGIAPLHEGKYIKISITDHGIGIPKEHLPKVFDPFFTTKQTGSGLGLTTSYSIIKNHDGHIHIESKIESGTTCDIYLPASDMRIGKKKAKKVEPGTSQGRILLMDDEDIIRNSVIEILQETGYELESARDGGEAVERYIMAKERGKPFDVVILDLTIRGGMGGKEAMNKLLEMDPEIKAIVSSGYSTDPVMSNFRRYGFAGCIVKPYKILQLRETIDKIINR